MFGKGDSPMSVEIGRLYWHSPNPVVGKDLSCSNCGYTFGAKERGTKTLVLVAHATDREAPNYCAACEREVEDNFDMSGYCRVRSLQLYAAELIDVSERWLHLATEEEITKHYLADEDRVDSLKAGNPFKGILGSP